MKTTENFRKVNLNEIETSSFNVRGKFNEDSLNELARSMEQNGLIHPLNLRAVGKNKYEIVCGERRFRAAKLLKFKEKTFPRQKKHGRTSNFSRLSGI